MKVAFINPHRGSWRGKLARRKKKKSFKKKHKPFKKKNRSTIVMATKRKRRRSTKRKNPFAAANPRKRTPRRRRSVFANRRHHTRRRNPEGGTITAGNVGTLAIGAIGGVVIYNLTTKMLQSEGNGKYITGAIIAIAGWWGLKKIYPGAALPFAAAVIAVTAKDYLDDSGMLNGIFGDGFTASDVNMLSDFQGNLGLIPPGIHGIVPADGYTQIESVMSGDGGDKY